MAIALGLLASALVFVMSLTIKRPNVIKLSLLLSLVCAAQFAVLGEWGTVFLNITTALYTVGLMLSGKFPQLGGHKAAYVLVAVYTTGFLLINGLALSWGLLSFAASIMGALMLMIGNPLRLKWAMLINGLLWTVFQVASGAYGQLPGEALYVAGVVYSIVMLTRARNRGKDLRSVPELTDRIRAWNSARKDVKTQAAVATLS